MLRSPQRLAGHEGWQSQISRGTYHKPPALSLPLSQPQPFSLLTFRAGRDWGNHSQASGGQSLGDLFCQPVGHFILAHARPLFGPLIRDQDHRVFTAPHDAGRR